MVTKFYIKLAVSLCLISRHFMPFYFRAAEALALKFGILINVDCHFYNILLAIFALTLVFIVIILPWPKKIVTARYSWGTRTLFNHVISCDIDIDVTCGTGIYALWGCVESMHKPKSISYDRTVYLSLVNISAVTTFYVRGCSFSFDISPLHGTKVSSTSPPVVLQCLQPNSLACVRTCCSSSVRKLPLARKQIL